MRLNDTGLWPLNELNVSMEYVGGASTLASETIHVVLLRAS
jgi:hypothetical protein